MSKFICSASAGVVIIQNFEAEVSVASVCKNMGAKTSRLPNSKIKAIQYFCPRLKSTCDYLLFCHKGIA